jgi:transposase
MAIKTRKHENLTETNVQHVIELLNDEKPITKKEACSILNISYNTTRLNKIIEDHLDTVAYRERRKSQNKGRGATEMEIKQVVNFYLDGANVSDIAKGLYRSPAFIKAIIDRVGIPQKLAQTDYEGRRNAMLPEQCVADEFEVGEKIWAVRQNYPALVEKELRPEQAEERGYRLYLCYTIECSQEDLKGSYFPHLSFAGKNYPLATYEMGKLEHLQKYL